MSLDGEQPRPVLEPPRFRLRTLLLLISGCCVLLVAINALDPYGKFALIMLVLTITAHIAGARLGHRLRDGKAGDGQARGSADGERFARVEAQQFAPRTRLSHRRGPGRLIVIMTIAWAVLGGCGGAALLYFINGERASPLNLASGATAFAVLGAIWGFALAAFLQELFGAIFEAHKVK